MSGDFHPLADARHCRGRGGRGLDRIRRLPGAPAGRAAQRRVPARACRVRTRRHRADRHRWPAWRSAASGRARSWAAPSSSTRRPRAARSRDQIAVPLRYSGRLRGGADGSGILAIASATMAGAIKEITIERGLDAREFVLFRLRRRRSPSRCKPCARTSHSGVIVPPHPGNFSALGMLLADASSDDTRTFIRALDGSAASTMDATFAEMEAAMSSAFSTEFAAQDIHSSATPRCDIEVRSTPSAVDVGGLSNAEAIAEAFEQQYRRRYGHADASGCRRIRRAAAHRRAARRPARSHQHLQIGAERTHAASTACATCTSRTSPAGWRPRSSAARRCRSASR